MNDILTVTRPAVERAAYLCGFTYDRLIRRGREVAVAEARFAVMLALYREGWSFPQIAEATGRSDHTTAINGVKAAVALEQSDPGFAIVVKGVAECAPKPVRKTWPRKQLAA